MTTNVIILILCISLVGIAVAFFVGKAFRKFIEQDNKKVEKKLQLHLERLAAEAKEKD